MANVKIDGYEFKVPDDTLITGNEIIKRAEEVTGRPISGVPFIKRENQDLVVRGDEAVVPKRDDLISFIEPFETAWRR